MDAANLNHILLDHNNQEAPHAAMDQGVIDALNGDWYIVNDSGEVEEYKVADVVPLADDFPGHDGADWFLANTGDLTSNLTPELDINNDDALAFMTDQVVHLKTNCGQDYAALHNDVLTECALIRVLLYKHRLVAGDPDLAAIHVNMYDLQHSAAGVNGTEMHAIRNIAGYDATTTAITQWLNANIHHVKFITKNISNLLCTVAYIFRQKGHHLVMAQDYGDAYTKIWGKVRQKKFRSPWSMLSTIATHAVPPCVLDAYWRYCVENRKCAAPLVLRLNCPASGTAAFYALKVGWDDGHSVYGNLLKGSDALVQNLNDLVHDMRTHKWRCSINAKYYGEANRRANASDFAPLATTVFGIYKSV